MPTDAPPSSPGSSHSDGSASTGPPCTPPSIFMNFTAEDTINGAIGAIGAERTAKAMRRVNTAERRATHNAVERQRRVTLHGRFLDLAALMSNLDHVRRPTKSVIVNSSIAYLNASGRDRILSTQHLRMMKSEADALRQEVNEWRAGAGVVFLEEPLRSEAFGILLRGELVVVVEAADMVEGDLSEDDDEASRIYGEQLDPVLEDCILPQDRQAERTEVHAAHAPSQYAPFLQAIHYSARNHALPQHGYAPHPQYAHNDTPPSPAVHHTPIPFNDPSMTAHPAVEAELGAKWAEYAMFQAHHGQQL
ncbi:hypothetical protein DFH06DRAFT_1168513 [Mycena polygramma]|nr:hypothetical protein DFH06DRAFT_1168513 [Mycena polygramma]